MLSRHLQKKFTKAGLSQLSSPFLRSNRGGWKYQSLVFQGKVLCVVEDRQYPFSLVTVSKTGLNQDHPPLRSKDLQYMELIWAYHKAEIVSIGYHKKLYLETSGGVRTFERLIIVRGFFLASAPLKAFDGLAFLQTYFKHRCFQIVCDKFLWGRVGIIEDRSWLCWGPGLAVCRLRALDELSQKPNSSIWKDLLDSKQT